MALFGRIVPLVFKMGKCVPIVTKSQKIHRYVAPTLMELKRREKRNGGKIINPRNTYVEWNAEAEIYAFGKRLGEEFDLDLLQEAFTDRSYVIKEEMKQKEIEFDFKMRDNRELAESGENFIAQYVQLYLETVLPKFPLEGIEHITRHLLSVPTLAHVSSNLGTKDIILAAEYPVDEYILANTFKAVIGALLESSGELKAGYLVRDLLITELNGKDVNQYWPIEDPLSMLKEILQNEGKEVEARLIGEVGRHTLLACYRVGLYVDKKMITAGFGEDIPTAKEMAAREALKKIFETEDHMTPMNFRLRGIPKPISDERYQISSSDE